MVAWATFCAKGGAQLTAKFLSTQEKNIHISKKNFSHLLCKKFMHVSTYQKKLSVFSNLLKTLIKGIFYLELKSDSVNTDKFSLTVFLPLSHSGNNISCGDRHKAAKYKNIFLWSRNDKSKSPHPLLPTQSAKKIGV